MTSKSWVSYSDIVADLLEVEAVVVDGPARHQSHVEIGEGDEREAQPREEHVVGIERRKGLPQPVAQRGLRELLDAAATDVPARVAAQAVQPEKPRVDGQHDRPDADPDPVPRLAERLD